MMSGHGPTLIFFNNNTNDNNDGDNNDDDDDNNNNNNNYNYNNNNQQNNVTQNTSFGGHHIHYQVHINTNNCLQELIHSLLNLQTTYPIAIKIIILLSINTTYAKCCVYDVKKYMKNIYLD